eukprot:TRINITY_DN17378_c0_g1_i1.p1 TRINITY_DN17378_c0_g1~~TRINITY_DN17378_c0_g1_i1.p1  ORF type:complete len:887 (+),score=111.98 TRINITY_DN17378_c0_g1_i1:184-2844(+)
MQSFYGYARPRRCEEQSKLPSVGAQQSVVAYFSARRGTFFSGVAETRPPRPVAAEAALATLVCVARSGVAGVGGGSYLVDDQRCVVAEAEGAEGEHEAPDVLARRAVEGAWEFSARRLADLAWSMAKLSLAHDGFADNWRIVATAATQSLSKSQSVRPRDLGRLAWSLARILLRDMPLLEGVAAAAPHTLATATTQEIASLAWSFSKLLVQHPSLFDAVALRASDCLFEIGPRNLSILAWSVAVASFASDPLIDGMASLAIQTVSEFNCQDVTQMAWAWASLRATHAPLFASLAAASLSRMNGFLPQDLTNTAWAFAKLLIRHEPLMSSIASASIAKLAQFDPQNLANTYWVLATVMHPNLPLQDAIATRAIHTHGQFSMQEVANMVWAMAHLTSVHAPLLHVLSRKAISEMSRGNQQNLTNTVWAFAQMRFANSTLFLSLAREIVGSISEFRPRDISITAWSFARMEIRDDALMDAIQIAARQRLVDSPWGTQELANLVWSFALLDVRHLSLLEESSRVAASMCSEEFTQQELTNIIWSHAGLRFRHEPLLAELSKRTVVMLSEFNAQSLASAAWGFEVLNWRDPRGDFLRLVIRRFQSVLHGSAPGVECVVLASAVEAVTSLGEEAASLLSHCHELVIDPAISYLCDIRRAQTIADNRDLEEAHQRLQSWVQEMQVPHLGSTHTRSALTAMGFATAPVNAEWLAEARRATLRSAWWSCPHAAVCSQGVVAWIAWTLHFVCSASLEHDFDSSQIRGVTKKVEEPGRVFFAEDATEQSILIEKMLQPIYLQVPRGGHAERQALIELLRTAARSFGSGEGAWSQTQGKVELYATHYPCISCLSVLARCARLLPRVDFVVEFDDAWLAWQERGSSDRALATLRIGRAE